MWHTVFTLWLASYPGSSPLFYIGRSLGTRLALTARALMDNILGLSCQIHKELSLQENTFEVIIGALTVGLSDVMYSPAAYALDNLDHYGVILRLVKSPT